MKFEVGKTYHHTYAREAIDFKCIHVDDGKAVLFWKSQAFPAGRSSVVDLDNEYYKEVKPKVKVDFWVNIYEEFGPGTNVHSSKLSADTAVDAGYKKIACIHIVQEVEEGEGL